MLSFHPMKNDKPQMSHLGIQDEASLAAQGLLFNLATVLALYSAATPCTT